ncbi:hypothetical protein [Streptomyces sp. NPDC086182]|uniref:hypothetical protein n=1 Tax=Streptomyces sp. NPDC086182 TaxID=3155058 RepID=UPI00344653F0
MPKTTAPVSRPGRVKAADGDRGRLQGRRRPAVVHDAPFGRPAANCARPGVFFTPEALNSAMNNEKSRSLTGTGSFITNVRQLKRESICGAKEN